MPKKIVYVIILTFVVGFCLGYEGTSHATQDYQAQISDANKKKSELVQKKKTLENEIAEIEKDKDNVLVYVEKLDARLEKSNQEIDTLNQQMTTQKTKLAKIKKQLKKAQQTEKKQYVTMCRRIKYMYENTSTEYLDIIFKAKNISDLLNRAEYVEKISEYDRTILIKYKKTKQKITEKKEKITQTVAELNATKDEVQVEKDAIQKLASNKQAQLKALDSSISQSKGKAAQYQAQVAAQEQQVESLLAAQRKQIEAQEKASQSKENNGSTNTVKTSNTKFRWPLRIAGTITSNFGARSSPTQGASSYHQGIDIGVSSGTPIVAAAAGTVVTAAYSSGAGNYIMIHHGGSTYTVYMHCSRLAVSSGKKVSQGDVIGYVGSTGISTGPHLHFGISIGGSYKNPLNYVSR